MKKHRRELKATYSVEHKLDTSKMEIGKTYWLLRGDEVKELVWYGSDGVEDFFNSTLDGKPFNLIYMEKGKLYTEEVLAKIALLQSEKKRLSSRVETLQADLSKNKKELNEVNVLLNKLKHKKPEFFV